MPRQIPFSEADARAAIAAAVCWADALRFLGYSVKGSNYKTLRRHAERWNISTEHFDPDVGRRRASLTRQVPLEEVLVDNSTYPRGLVKYRLLALGMKQPVCELCGQGEKWNGRRMSLVLDHINGIANDHRLENLRMVCPNCAATLDTHCGRNLPRRRVCPACGNAFAPKDIHHRYCSRSCWGRINSQTMRGEARPLRRKVARPPYEQLLAEIEATSFVAVGRKYGVSDNAVRKWLRWYQYRREQNRRPEPPPRREESSGSNTGVDFLASRSSYGRRFTTRRPRRTTRSRQAPQRRKR